MIEQTLQTIVFMSIPIASLCAGLFFFVRLVLAGVRREPHAHWSVWYLIGAPISAIGFLLIIIGGVLAIAVGDVLYDVAIYKLIQGPPGRRPGRRDPGNTHWEAAWPPEVDSHRRIQHLPPP